MNKKKVGYICLLLMKGLNVLVSALMFWLCFHFIFSERYQIGKSGYGDILIIFLYSFIKVLLNNTYNAFEVGNLKNTELIYSLCVADGVGLVIFLVLMTIGWADIPNPFPFMGVFVIIAAWNALWAICATKIFFMIYNAKKTIVLYQTENDLEKLSELEKYKKKYCVLKYICAPTSFDEVEGEIQKANAVFISGISHELRNTVVEYCIQHDRNAYFVPDSGDVVLAGARHLQMFSVPILHVGRAHFSPQYLIMKRVMDIFVSLLAIILLSPIMLICAAAIKLCDGGPILYKQVRLTRDRKEFKIWKFRSMRVDAEKDGVARLASVDDDRITPVGKVIRALRMDEIPQLFNILGGCMSVVGPRPERPEIAKEYEEDMPAFALRLQVKAGLTGYAQVYGKYNTQPHDKLQMDLLYINKMSFMEDIRLMFATVKILFMRESTEGVEKGQTTASVKKER